MRIPPSRLLWSVAWLLVMPAAVWAAGLAWFIGSVLIAPSDRNNNTDAIVVLTGGRQRLETGVELLAAGRAHKLFISGVNQRVDRGELLHMLGPTAEQVACCIVLGHDADSTLANARETAGWIGEQGYRSLRLVTSWYHMPRSLLEFRRAMPQTTIIPHPVFAHRPEPGQWSSWREVLLLSVEEYNKYLGVWLRPLLGSVMPALYPDQASPAIQRDTMAAAPLRAAEEDRTLRR